MNRVKVLLLLGFLTGFSYAGTGTISGTVTDGTSGEPLPGTNIRLQNTAIGAVTGGRGTFNLTGVPEGIHTLHAQLMGYAKAIVTGIRVKADSTVKLDIRLKQTAIEGEAVTITAQRAVIRKDMTASHRPVDSEDAVSPEAPPPAFKAEGKDMSADRPAPASAEAPKRQSSGLKAGFSDDNRQFNYFLQFLGKYRDQVSSCPIAVQERIILNARDSRGRTLPDAEVTVTAGEKALASGKTYADGSFLFFPSEYDSGLTRYRFDIRYGSARKSIEADRRGRREIQAALDIQKPDPQAVPIDLLFILDTTGSMSEEIERLKQTIDLINLNLVSLGSKPAVRFGIVLYRDQSDVYVTRTVPFTGRIELFREALGTVQADGGGDGPEDLQSALAEGVLHMDWTPDGIRLAFVITDAPPHLDYGQTYTYADAAHDAKRKGIKVFGIGAGGLDLAGEMALRQIAQYTSARYIFLTYGERGESEGGKTGSVSHHTGDNYETGKLEAVVLRIAKEELGQYSDAPPEETEDYFAAGRAEDESREETLKKLFDMAVAQLIDFSTLRIRDATPACLIPLSCEAGPAKQDAEYFSEQLLLSLTRNPTFRMVERKNLQQIVDELKLGMTGLFDDENAVRAGRLTGADLLVSGSLICKPEGFEIFLKLLRTETAEILSVTKLKADLKLGVGDEG